MKQRSFYILALITFLFFLVSCDDNTASDKAVDLEVDIRMYENYFYGWINHSSDEDWTTKGGASFTVDGIAMVYNAAYDQYSVQIPLGVYSAGDAVSVTYTFSDFESKTIAATVPADLPEPSGSVISPVLPSAGTPNTATTYSITPETANGVSRFNVTIDRYGSNSSIDMKSGYSWMYFQTVFADSENLTLDDGSVVPFLNVSVSSSSFVSDNSYYKSVDFILSGREGYSMTNLSSPSGGRADLLRSSLSIEPVFQSEEFEITGH